MRNAGHGLKRELKRAAVGVAKALGRYADWDPGERLTRQADAAWFKGDIPPMAGTESNQYRLVYSKPQPLITHANDVTYTIQGMAWLGGRLERRFSFQEIGLRQICEAPGGERRVYARGSILQSQTPCTYGDWVSEHLAALALALTAGQFVEPLLLPGYWFEKPYVSRDLATLGVRAEGLVETVRIEHATVINKTRISHYWVRPEVEAVIAAMRIEPRESRRGTAIYLSRRGEKGEGPRKREIDNALIEDALQAAGVEIVRTAGLRQDQYIALASGAETVFADHGSAMYNMLHWKTRRVVELFSPDYWDSSFLFFADSLGIHDYHLWQIDASTTLDALTKRARELLCQAVGPAATMGSTR